MATYRELHGKAVKTVTTNPSDDAAEGQIWFNSTDNTFKSIVTSQAFSSTGVLNTARGWMGSAGDKTAGIVFGGSINPYPIFTTLTEEYNGTGWSVEATCPSALGGIGSAGVGTQTAALQFGANGGSGYTNNSAHYNGSSWTAGGNMNTTGRDRTGGGIQTAAIGANAYIPGSQAEPNSETYNGSAWTAISGTGSARYEAMGFGTQTAFATCGGRNPPTTNLTATEEYDGSSWTTGGTLPQGTHKGQGAGTQTAGTIAGGVGAPYYPNYNYLSNKVDYDGSTWAISPATMTTARAYYGGDSANSNPNFYTCGGTGPSGLPYQSSSEEFNVSANIITSASWSSGGSLNSARRGSGSGGIKTAAYYAGGIESAASAKTETYDGTSFSEVNDLGTARYGLDTNMGTLTAGLVAGGRGGGTTYGNTEEWDGTNWSEQTDLSTARRYTGGFGTQTAGVVFGGRTAPNAKTTATEEYNGSSWTTGGAMNTTREYASGCGVETAGLTLAGSPGTITDVEHYNGTAWSEQSAAFPGQRSIFGISGAQTNALIFGGEPPSSGTATAFVYDGTSFATSPSMGTARSSVGSPGPAGTSTSAIAIGGYTSTNVTTTEEFTGETTSVNVKTLTQS